MAVLTQAQLGEIGRNASRKLGTARTDKTTFFAAFQAIEDWFESAKPAGVTAVDVATAPYTYSMSDKKILFAAWLDQKFRRES